MNAQSLAVFVAGVVTIISGCGMNADRAQLPDVSNAESVGEQEVGVSTPYTVADYDPDASPADNLLATVSQASKSGKRIILEVGGQW